MKYYCNACGELHIHCANGTLSDVESFTDIPFPLQEVYQRYCREGGSGMLNYLAEVDRQPELLLIAEYRVDGDCDGEQKRYAWLAAMDELYKKEVVPYAKTVEMLLRSIGTLKTRVNVFIGEYSGILECHEVAVFIPKALGHNRIVRALYAINELNRGVPPEQIDATPESEGLKAYRSGEEIRDYAMAWPLRIPVDQRSNPLQIKFLWRQKGESRIVNVYTKMKPAELTRKIKATVEKIKNQMTAAHVEMPDEFEYLAISALNNEAPSAWEFAVIPPELTIYLA